MSQIIFHLPPLKHNLQQKELYVEAAVDGRSFHQGG